MNHSQFQGIPITNKSGSNTTSNKLFNKFENNVSDLSETLVMLSASDLITSTDSMKLVPAEGLLSDSD